MIKNSQYKTCDNINPRHLQQLYIAMALQAPMGCFFILLSSLSMGFFWIQHRIRAVLRLNWVKVNAERGEDWSRYEHSVDFLICASFIYLGYTLFSLSPSHFTFRAMLSALFLWFLLSFTNSLVFRCLVQNLMFSFPLSFSYVWGFKQLLQPSFSFSFSFYIFLSSFFFLSFTLSFGTI